MAYNSSRRLSQQSLGIGPSTMRRGSSQSDRHIVTPVQSNLNLNLNAVIARRPHAIGVTTKSSSQDEFETLWDQHLAKVASNNTQTHHWRSAFSHVTSRASGGIDRKVAKNMYKDIQARRAPLPRNSDDWARLSDFLEKYRQWFRSGSKEGFTALTKEWDTLVSRLIMTTHRDLRTMASYSTMPASAVRKDDAIQGNLYSVMGVGSDLDMSVSTKSAKDAHNAGRFRKTAKKSKSAGNLAGRAQEGAIPPVPGLPGRRLSEEAHPVPALPPATSW